MNRTSLFAVTSVIFLAALTRLMPHPWNFTPIGAMALFGGAHLANRSLAFLIPLLAMFVSDMILGFSSGMLVVYLAFMAVTCIGMALRGRIRPLPVAMAAFTSSVLFFLVTNNVFLHADHGMFPRTFEGMMQCYAFALPFFANTLGGDLLFTGLLFGGYALLVRNIPALKTA